MAATISESYLSRPFTLSRQNGRELVYDVAGTDDEEAVRALLLATAPGAYLGLAIESIDAEPIGNGNWKARAKYLRFLDDSEYTFDTGGGTTKVTQSLATINRYAPAGLTAPDFHGAIGVSEDRVDGVDVPTPTFQFSETHRFSDAFMEGGFKLVLFNMTGRMNNDSFKGLAAGECLFLGASGARRGDELWSITFRFAASPNVSGLAIGGITGIDKFGWDYLWVRYADFEDSSANALVKRPVAAYVERVSLPGDFSLLSIGT